MKRLPGIVLLLLATFPAAAQQPQFAERGRFSAEEAHQAVAVDSAFFYAIASRSIGKYDKSSGEKMDAWTGVQDGAIGHLNSGVVVGDRLYTAHSNFPDLPMVSSVEVFDTATMRHVGTHSFGVFIGSGTWLDRHDDFWWMVFAHYGGDGGEPGKGPRWTTLVKFDDHWQPRGSWIFPESVVERFEPYSSSGGAWGPDGLLYVTGHDRAETYVLRLPQAGSVLELVDILPITNQGQGIAWDRSDPGTLYGIRRADRQVVVSELIGRSPDEGTQVWGEGTQLPREGTEPPSEVERQRRDSATGPSR